MPRHFDAGGEFEICVALLDGEVVAGAARVLLQRHGRVLHARGATTTHRPQQPLALLLVDAMAAAAATRLPALELGRDLDARRTACTASSASGAPERPLPLLRAAERRVAARLRARELRARFRDFYVVPFSALRSSGGS